MIDVHAHYMPRPLVERLQRDGARYGVSVVETERTCMRTRSGSSRASRGTGC